VKWFARSWLIGFLSMVSALYVGAPLWLAVIVSCMACVAFDKGVSS